MKRVWLSIFVLIASLVGGQWLSNPARSEESSQYPGVDAGSEGQSGCQDVEKTQVYGECHWYHDEQYQPDTTCEIVPDEPMADETLAAESDAAETASTAEPAMGSPMPSAVVGQTDCWYDGETDAYYHYRFSGAAVVAGEDSLTKAASPCDTESYADEAYVEDGCHEPAAQASEAADVATEQAWDGDDEEYADTADGMDASRSVEDQADADAGFTADSEAIMDSTTDVTEATTPSAETPATWPSREYDYKYSGSPYDYESNQPAYVESTYVEPTYSEPGYIAPVQEWDDDADADVVAGEDDEESVPPAPTSGLVEFDSELILSLARTLNRVGSTLQSLSEYLTEMATAETADHHSETLHR